ncbi:MAG: hypothetical protein ACXQT3_06355 [Methermicoccaceae archaeon]
MRLLWLLVVVLVVASVGAGYFVLSEREEHVPSTPYVEQYPELKAHIDDVHIEGTVHRAGEPLTASLTIRNTGSVVINRERVVVVAKVVRLNSKVGNLMLAAMSDEQKRREYVLDVRTPLEPNGTLVLTRSFLIPKEIKGVSLAGTYRIEVALYIGAEGIPSTKRAHSRVIQLELE